MEKELLAKLEKYCAYQERCHFEVRQKAWSIGLIGGDVDLAMLHLLQHNFLNEERFVALYVRSKINQKKWGSIKIEQALRIKRIEAKLIQKELNRVEEKVWIKNANHLAKKYITEKKVELSTWKGNRRLASHLISKGYLPYIVERVVKSLC